jgi:hypothetical protein
MFFALDVEADNTIVMKNEELAQHFALADGIIVFEAELSTEEPEIFEVEPTEPGFYKYIGNNSPMIFLRDYQDQWYAIVDNGTIEPCVWGYIEQGMSVYKLVKL